jgi:hypothetical protein
VNANADSARALLAASWDMLHRNVEVVTLDEALAPAGRHRSVLGITKHVAAWTHVYYSYAFDAHPTHWERTTWPRGLRDTIDPSQGYLDEARTWLDSGAAAWSDALREIDDDAIDEPRPCHWGATAPLFDIVVMVATHWTYHAGEINALLSIVRGEAWEYGEEVEENHISTAGHRIRPGWMSDAHVAAYEAAQAARDRDLRAPHGPA